MSPSNTFLKLQLLERYHQNCQAVSAATGMSGLTSLGSQWPKAASHFWSDLYEESIVGNYLKEKC